MSKLEVNIGTTPNDSTGDTLRDAFEKVNLNFNEVYDTFGNGSNVSNSYMITLSSVYNFANLLSDQLGALSNTVIITNDDANNLSEVVILAYDQANTGTDLAIQAYDQANTAYDQANTGTDLAIQAYDQANTAYDQANIGTDLATQAYDQANTAFTKSNTFPYIISGYSIETLVANAIIHMHVLAANVYFEQDFIGSYGVPTNESNTQLYFDINISGDSKGSMFFANTYEATFTSPIPFVAESGSLLKIIAPEAITSNLESFAFTLAGTIV